MKDLLRISTAGSVDDGKSTLIGRLLFESGTLLKDQLLALKPDATGALPWAHLTDGLRAEREQGITIDVAYRFFSTPKRSFIVADSPGHAEFTRNMAVGASTADCAIILIDAQRGLRPQSRRHAAIAGLLGVPTLILAINKMDLVDYSQRRFDLLCEQMLGVLASFGGQQELHFLPMSALHGVNLVKKSEQMPWYEGEPLLTLLEQVTPRTAETGQALRMPVQLVLKGEGTFRGYCGTLAAGSIRRGEQVQVLPGGLRSRVVEIYHSAQPHESARAGQAVTLCLEDELAISRGSVFVDPSQPPQLAHELEADLVWLHATPLSPHATYLLKHSSQLRRITVQEQVQRLDLESGARELVSHLEGNEIGRVRIHLHRPLVAAPYAENRELGAFLLIDPVQNHTLAAGVITSLAQPNAASPEEAWFDLALHPHEQAQEIARLLETLLDRRGIRALALDASRHPEAIGHFSQTLGVLPIWANLPGEPGQERFVVVFHNESSLSSSASWQGQVLWINRRLASPDEAAHLIMAAMEERWLA